MLETFPRAVGPWWHDSTPQLLQSSGLHIRDVNPLFQHIPKVLLDWDLVPVVGRVVTAWLLVLYRLIWVVSEVSFSWQLRLTGFISFLYIVFLSPLSPTSKGSIQWNVHLNIELKPKPEQQEHDTVVKSNIFIYLSRIPQNPKETIQQTV